VIHRIFCKKKIKKLRVVYVKLKDKVAIVTGGSQGIGKAIALAFAGQGAQVVIAARTASRLAEALKELQAIRPPSLAIKTDVADESQVKAMVKKVFDEFGSIDILVNNASIMGPTKMVIEIAAEEWQEVLNVNLLGTVFCSREALRVMMKQKHGNIINVTSVAGKTGRALRTPYAAAKAAVINFTHSLAMEFAPYNIRINGVCPGTVEGERIYRVFTEKAKKMGISYEEAAQQRIKETPMGRLIQPEEVAALAVFLASEDASGMTGQVINVSGGREMR
jgi:NAD(P)-dependent dehydrogenase (short-subunit alcohol dehydrogenase family)